MRIVSGKFRSRRIVPPKGFNARPTTDFAKENLFNILQNYFDFENCDVLDLFSGTGSISYEFQSRGCLSVVSVESKSLHHSFIRKTMEELSDPSQKAKAICSDAFSYVQRCKYQFDIIFADPPYDLLRINELPDLIFAGKLIRGKGWFILEHSSKISFTSHPRFSQTRTYSAVNFSIFQNK